MPYRDVRATDLSWALDAPDEPALHRQVHTVGPLSVEVRILGASHQIIVWKDGRELCRETVACRDGAAGPLPAAAERVLDAGFRYEIRCEVRRVGTDDFASWAKALRGYADTVEGSTIALFPDVPDAITAAVVEPLPSSLDGVLWRTWHTYPDSGTHGGAPEAAGTGHAYSKYSEVVATRTLLHRPTPL